MSFSASQRNINTILSSNTIFNIPKNQRKYVWKENEWNELFEDIFLIEQSKEYSHFLGSIVLAKEKENNQFSIIDGQQRLTTICLLILAIANQLYSISEDKIAESYKNTFLKINKDGDDYYKVERKEGNFFLMNLIELVSSYKDNEMVKKEFFSVFGKTDKYNESLLNCFLYFDNMISSYLTKESKKKEYLISLKEKLVNSEVIEIVVEKDVDGYRVFETLNARGIPLEQHELIKNYLYSYLRKKAQIQKLDKGWSKIVSNLTFAKIDYFSTFISHYCTHIYGKTKKNEEFKTIRTNTPKNKTESLLTSLIDNSLYYSFFLDPSKLKEYSFNNTILHDSLMFFKNLNIRQVRPLLLSLFEKCSEGIIDLTEMVKSVSLLETFYFLFTVVSKNTSNTIDSAIISLSTSIHSSKDKHPSELIKEELAKYVSEKEKLKANFTFIGYSNKNKNYKNSSNKKIVNYIFKRIEKFYDENDELEPKINSIEHILNDSETDTLPCYIGNLLPMSPKLNNKAGDKSFAEKLVFYKRSKLLSVSRFIEANGEKTEWLETDISSRGKELAKLSIENIWVF